MATGRQIERQIDTIEDLRDIVHSMRSLAATYLARAEQRLDGLRAYADTVGRAIGDALVGREIALPQRQEGGAAVLAFFSEQGLAGRFNEVMAEAAARYARGLDGPRFIVVGRRGPPLLRARGAEVLAALPSTTSPDGDDQVIHAIARTVLDLHAEGAFRELHLVYARYLSPGRIEPSAQRVLPIDLAQWRSDAPARAAAPALSLPRAALLAEFVNEYVFISLLLAMTESLAGEHGMRLESMEAARTNIDEKLAELHLLAGIQRQNDITAEMLEIVSGAEALAAEEEE